MKKIYTSIRPRVQTNTDNKKIKWCCNVYLLLHNETLQVN